MKQIDFQRVCSVGKYHHQVNIFELLNQASNYRILNQQREYYTVIIKKKKCVSVCLRFIHICSVIQAVLSSSLLLQKWQSLMAHMASVHCWLTNTVYSGWFHECCSWKIQNLIQFNFTEWWDHVCHLITAVTLWSCDGRTAE